MFSWDYFLDIAGDDRLYILWRPITLSRVNAIISFVEHYGIKSWAQIMNIQKKNQDPFSRDPIRIVGFSSLARSTSEIIIVWAKIFTYISSRPLKNALRNFFFIWKQLVFFRWEGKISFSLKPYFYIFSSRASILHS